MQLINVLNSGLCCVNDVIPNTYDWQTVKTFIAQFQTFGDIPVLENASFSSSGSTR